MPMDYEFNAQQYEPRQGAGPHPVGDFVATISETSIVPTKDGTGGLFQVNFTTDHGKQTRRFNLWNPNTKAVEIAHHELSALCHATGVYNVSMRNDGAALHGARCKIRVGLQAGDEAKEKGYTEIKLILDMNGNEPGKAPAPQQAAPPAAAPAAGAPWGAPAAPPAAAPWGAAPTSATALASAAPWGTK